MFPEGLTVVTPSDMEFLDWIDSGESVTLGIICGMRGLNSVGVGGVTVVAGAGMAV